MQVQLAFAFVALIVAVGLALLEILLQSNLVFAEPGPVHLSLPREFLVILSMWPLLAFPLAFALPRRASTSTDAFGWLTLHVGFAFLWGVATAHWWFVNPSLLVEDVRLRLPVPGVIASQIALSWFVFRSSRLGWRLPLALLTLTPFVGAVVPAILLGLRSSVEKQDGRRLFALACTFCVTFLTWSLAYKLLLLHYSLSGYAPESPVHSLPAWIALAVTLFLFAWTWRESDPGKLIRVLARSTGLIVLAFAVSWGASLGTGPIATDMHDESSLSSGDTP